MGVRNKWGYLNVKGKPMQSRVNMCSIISKGKPVKVKVGGLNLNLLASEGPSQAENVLQYQPES